MAPRSTNLTPAQEDIEFWFSVRRLLLGLVDEIETRKLRFEPTTAHLRQANNQEHQRLSKELKFQEQCNIPD